MSPAGPAVMVVGLRDLGGRILERIEADGRARR